MKKLACIFGLVFILCGCAYLGYIKDPFVDIPNFHQVDNTLYRGGQPNEAGFKKLSSLGIKTVISLRGENETLAKEKQQTADFNMRFYNLPMSVYETPEDQLILKFLEIVLDSDSQPVFVHCQNGRDRTGAIVAMYRVVVWGFTIKNAYKEAKNLGFWPYRGEAQLKNFIHQLKDKKIYFEKKGELTRAKN
jgi:protein tyrosine phosphatase (PTP) superfamily phosphohydrolase (DUF442 family)